MTKKNATVPPNGKGHGRIFPVKFRRMSFNVENFAKEICLHACIKLKKFGISRLFVCFFYSLHFLLTSLFNLWVACWYDPFRILTALWRLKKCEKKEIISNIRSLSLAFISLCRLVNFYCNFCVPASVGICREKYIRLKPLTPFLDLR